MVTGLNAIVAACREWMFLARGGLREFVLCIPYENVTRCYIPAFSTSLTS